MSDDQEQTSLAEELPRLIARIRSEVLPAYDKIETGKWAASMIRMQIEDAERAILHNDVVQMIKSYASLKEIKL